MSALAHGVRTVGNEFTRLQRHDFCTVEHTGGAVRQLTQDYFDLGFHSSVADRLRDGVRTRVRNWR